MLNQQDDDGGGKRASKLACEFLVEDGNLCVLETSGNVKEDLELGSSSGEVLIGQPTDHGVQQNNKDCPECREEEGHSLVLRPTPGDPVAQRPDTVKHEECRQAHGSIQLGTRQALQSVDEDQVRRVSGGKAFNAHQGRELPDSNVESRAGHESRKSSERDDIDNPTAPNQANEKDDGAREDRQGRSDNMARNVRKFFHNIGNNTASQRGQDGDGTDRNIFRSGEEPVDQYTHEGRVKAKLRLEVGKLGIGHALWNDNGTDSNTWSRSKQHWVWTGGG